MPLLIKIILEVLATVIRQDKRNKWHPDWKGRSKIVIICRRHDTVHRKPHRIPPKLLELINELYTVAEYKTNIQKSTVFLYTNNKLSETETKKTIHLEFHQKE